MNNFDLTKFLAEGKLHEGTMTEALNKPVTQLGPDVEKRLKSMGFDTKIFPNPQGGIPANAVEAIAANPKLAGLSFNNNSGFESMRVMVSPERKKDLQKLRGYFQVPEEEFGPEKKLDWVAKQIQNTNPGDWTASQVEVLGSGGDPVAVIDWYRLMSKGASKTTDADGKTKMDLGQAAESLNEAISPQDIVDIADTVAEEFTKEDADGGIFMVYSVGKMDVDDMTFELDTDTTSQTPERILNMSNLGVGEGWGGSFRIKPTGEGYEVRNTEKGGLVAIIDNMGSFKMISNDEAKAEMGRTKGEETDFMQNRKEMDDYAMDENKEIKSNKMKKSELKEMIKAAVMADTAVYEAEDVEVTDDEDVDIDIEKDVKVDDEESEVDIDIDAELPGEDGDVTEVLALLMKSQQAAEDIGDEKLMDQIGNTITYFTRSHVANVNEADLDMDLDSAAGRAKEATIGLDEEADTKSVLRTLIQDLEPFEYEVYAFDAGVDPEDGAEMEEYIASLSDMEVSSEISKLKGINEDKTEELDEKKQGYNDELDDSEGAKHGKKKQDMAQRRADSENMEKAAGKRKYSGDKSKDLNESVTFPMWNKIK